MLTNCDVRNYAKSKGVYLYEVATACGVSEPTIMRRLRVELSDGEKRELYAVIDRIAVEHAEQLRIAATSTK